MKKHNLPSRHIRKLQKHSDKFNELFAFYLKCYRSGLLRFCGSNVNVKFKIDGTDAKLGFKLYEQGEGSLGKIITTRHPNILKGVIISKKSFGLFLKEWTEGIAECSFTKEEILNEFHIRNIKVPESLLIEFENLLIEKRIEYHERYRTIL